MRENVFELPVLVVGSGWIEREECNLVGLRQGRGQPIATDPAAVIQRHQSAGLYPQNSHLDIPILPADALVGRLTIRTALLLQIHEVDDDLIWAESVKKSFTVNGTRSNKYDLRGANNFL